MTAARWCQRSCVALLVACFAGLATPGRATVTLSVVAPQTEYLLDEPLFLTVTLANSGPTDVPVLRCFSPGAGLLRFGIARPGEEEHEYAPWVQEDPTPSSLREAVVELPPEGSYSGVVDLTYEMRDGRCEPVFSEGGQYEIRVAYVVPRDWPTGPYEIGSAGIVLTVAPPSGAEKDAYDALTACPAYPLWPWNAAPQSGECYDRVVREHGGSRYATYAGFYLAQVEELRGLQALRGTADAAAAIERAAELYSVVAQTRPEQPLGRHATRLAARCLATLGRSTDSQAVLEQAFASPSATDAERADALAWLGLVEEGVFQRDGGLSASGSRPVAVLIPLRSFAQALGLSVGWSGQTGAVTVSSRKVRASLRPGQDRMVVNGVVRTGVRVAQKDGRTRVSPSVIATLMAEQWGKGMENAFPPQMIARAAPER